MGGSQGGFFYNTAVFNLFNNVIPIYSMCIEPNY